MEQALGIASLIGFVLALSAHVVSLFGVDVIEHVPYVWALHIGVFAVFLPFILSSRRTLGAKPGFKDIQAAFPKWALIAGICLVIYAAVNFMIFMSLTEGGGPKEQDGKYLLLNHGKVIRTLTTTEYHALRANEIRGFSGHWLVFYFVPFAYFIYRKKFNLSLDSGVPRRSA